MGPVPAAFPPIVPYSNWIWDVIGIRVSHNPQAEFKQSVNDCIQYNQISEELVINII